MIFTLLPTMIQYVIILSDFKKKVNNYPTFEVSDKKLTLLDCRDLLNFIFCSSFNSEYNLVKKL